MDWAEASEVVVALNNLMTAWAGFLELATSEPDGPYAEDDRREAVANRARLHEAIHLAAAAGGLWERHGQRLLRCDTPAAAAEEFRPFVGASLQRRQFERALGERLAVGRAAESHAALLRAAIRGGDQDTLERVIAAAWADRLLSPEEAEILAGPDPDAATRRAVALGIGWPR